ncbi:MAG: type II toxin-antitoxin system Phd/YefM family antitoxin [Rhodospirillales bacterium]|nr:MAG: type II toxin-antitoxin system Phd/YefM family antitoxin [Rhodospirillales bacterium]
MSRASWPLQDAKNSLSRLVAAAEKGEPQLVTKHGRPAVVVVEAHAFERMAANEKKNRPSFVDLLLAMPKDDGEFERIDATLRDVEF